MKRHKGKIAALAGIMAATLISGVTYAVTDNTPCPGDKVTVVNERDPASPAELDFAVPGDGQTERGTVAVGSFPLDDYAAPSEEDDPFTVTAKGSKYLFTGLTEAGTAWGTFDSDGNLTIHYSSNDTLNGPIDGMSPGKWKRGQPGQIEGDLAVCGANSLGMVPCKD